MGQIINLSHAETGGGLSCCIIAAVGLQRWLGAALVGLISMISDFLSCSISSVLPS